MHPIYYEKQFRNSSNLIFQSLNVFKNLIQFSVYQPAGIFILRFILTSSISCSHTSPHTRIPLLGI